MNEPILKTKKSKSIVFLILAIIVVSVIAYTIIGTMISSRNESNLIKISEQLPDNIKQLISAPTFSDKGKNFEGIVSEMVDNSKKTSFSKFIYFKDAIGGAQLINTEVEAVPDKEINEKLHMPLNEIGDLDGIILQKTNFLKVGYYVAENGSKVPGDALKSYYTLTYVSLPQGVPTHRDTLWGTDPDKETSIEGNFTGNYPSVQDIVSKINSTLLKK